MTATPARSYTAVAIAIVIAGVLISASLYVAVEAPTWTTTATSTTTTTRTVTATGTSSQTDCSEITVNGSGYCSLDVTDNMTLQQSGYSVLNAPVTFMGVTFESTCQYVGASCATENQSAFQKGVIAFNIIYSGGGGQYLSAPYPSSSYQEEYYWTAPPPMAGFLLEGTNTAPYLRVILLVEPGLQPTPTALANSENSLQLQVHLNSSSLASGSAVSVTVDDYNTLATANNVTAANDWLVPLSGADGAPCGDNTAGLVGFAIAEGRYTSSNVTAAKFLDLVNPGVTYSCTVYLGYANPPGFLFLPMSEAADSYGCQQMCLSGSASTGLTTSGYWNQGGAFMGFPRGAYTVLGEDEWGDSALAYFTVS